MKNLTTMYWLLLILLLVHIAANAQRGLGTNTPAASAILELKSTSKGFLLPRMTSDQINIITSPVKGLLVFDTNWDSFFYYNGNEWERLLRSFGPLEDKDGDTKIQVEKNTDEDIIRFDTNGLERMSIYDNGNVGIGAIAPSYKLDISGDMRATGNVFSDGNVGIGTTGIHAWTDHAWTDFSFLQVGELGSLSSSSSDTFLAHNGYISNGHWKYATSSNTASVYRQTIGKHMWYTAEGGTGTAGEALTNVEAMRIESNGSVGIGTMAPSYKLDISGDMRATGNVFSDGNVGIGTTGIHAWTDHAWTDFSFLQVGELGSLSSSSSDTFLAHNGYISNGHWKYATSSNTASVYRQTIGKHMWYTAEGGTGTAGGALTNVEAMRIESNGNVGIGNMSPSYKLDINGTNRSNVVIAGDLADQHPLDIKLKVVGDAFFQGRGVFAVGSSRVSIPTGDFDRKTRSTDGAYWAVPMIYRSAYNETTPDVFPFEKYGELMIQGNSHGEDYHKGISFVTWNGVNGDKPEIHARIDSVGNFGIGTVKPNYKLDIKGNMRVDGKVYLGPNPTEATHDYKLDIKGNMRVDGKVYLGPNPTEATHDYVFDKYYTGKSADKPNYRMLSLSEVAIFTKENRHLPGIPGRDKILATGKYSLDERAGLNLAKIEELFLHTIEQQQQIDAQKEQNKKQQAVIENLMKRLKVLEAKN